MSENLSRGERFHIRGLKPEARGSLNEADAWERVNEILSTRLENYPEKYGANLSVVRKFHSIRWEHRFSSQSALREALSAFLEENPEEVLDELKSVFGVIAQIYSRP